MQALERAEQELRSQEPFHAAALDELGTDALATTQRNARRASGNTNPRAAYMSRPSVELTAQGLAWANEQLERAFENHGQLAPEVLDELDWSEGSTDLSRQCAHP